MRRRCRRGRDLHGPHPLRLRPPRGPRRQAADHAAAPEEGVLALLDRAPVAPPRSTCWSTAPRSTTNALLERRLARVGLITTEGFRDVLELGRRDAAPRLWAHGGLHAADPARPAPRGARADGRGGRGGGAAGRGGGRGGGPAAPAAGCEAVVVHFLHAYRNPAHERRAARARRARSGPTPSSRRPRAPVGATRVRAGRRGGGQRGRAAGARPLPRADCATGSRRAAMPATSW